MKFPIKTKTFSLGLAVVAAAATCIPATAKAQALPDFALLDQNPTSDRSGELVSLSDYRHQISAYYFGASN